MHMFSCFKVLLQEFHFFCERLLALLENIFEFDARHYSVVLLTGGPEIMKGSVFFEYFWQLSLF